MKKLLSIMTMLVMCLAFTACGGESAEQSDVQAPYLGYAPLTEETLEMVDTFTETFGNSPTLDLLKYDAGDNNVAIVRMEKSKKDGTWKTVEEQRLLLIYSANAGYMVFKGDACEGVTVNTALIARLCNI